MDISCDAFGGVFLCFGVLFYLIRRFDPIKQSDHTWKTAEAGSVGMYCFIITKTGVS